MPLTRSEIAGEMWAAVVNQLGALPVYQKFPRATPATGQALISVKAAGLNPVDVSMAAGRHYGLLPEPPYVPGGEGAGVVVMGQSMPPGTRVRFEVTRGHQGSMAEWAVADESRCVPLPVGLDYQRAAGLGIVGTTAWLGLIDRGRLKPGDRVLVLGATGVVGQLAVQISRLAGAGRVVAGGRDRDTLPRAIDLGADATVCIARQSPARLAREFVEAAQGRIDLVLDPVWGRAAEAAVLACGPGGRIVNLGDSAGREASLNSQAIRGNDLTVVGYANQLLSLDLRAEAFRAVAALTAAGHLRLDIDAIPLRAVQAGWDRQAASPHVKLVLVPAD